MSNRKTTIRVSGKELSAILKKLDPDHALTDKYSFADGVLLLKCTGSWVDKIPQSKEDVFCLLCEETPWDNELERSRSAVLDTLETFEYKTVEGFYGDTIADVTDYIEEAAFKKLGVRDGDEFDGFCTEALACNCELTRIYVLEGESVKLAKEDFRIIG